MKRHKLNKKILSFIIILLFFITIITAANAADNTTNTNTTTTSSIKSIDTHTTDNTVSISSDYQSIKKDNVIKNNNTKTKQQKKATHSVNSYEELYNTIEDIKSTSTENDEIIDLNPGDYNITKTINWGNTSHTTKTLTINGNKVTLDGGKQYQFITITTGYSLKLNNIIINNCTAENGAVAYNGGTLEIKNSEFTSNSATNGGVFYNNATGTVNIINSTVNENNATSKGGVFYNNEAGIINIENSTFNRNNATNETNETYGGVIYNNATGNITIKKSIFNQNSAINEYNSAIGEGGVIYNNKTGTINIENSTFNGTNATKDGGVFYNRGTLIINDSNINNSFACGDGVVVFNNRGIVNITSSSFNNSTGLYIPNPPYDVNGGVIYNYYGTIIVVNSTFNNTNTTGEGGVIYNEEGNFDIINSNFTNSLGGNRGGVIFNYNANMNITDSLFINATSKYSGGVMTNEGVSNVNITNSTFMNNTIKSGGVIENAYDGLITIIIKDSNFINNSATSVGGVIRIIEENNLTIINSNFTNNTAGNGGVIYSEGYGDTWVINSNFINNTAENGSVNYNKDKVIIDNSIFKNNNAQIGGVNYNDGNLNIINSNFTNNTATSGGVNYNNGNMTITSSNFIENIGSCSANFNNAGGVMNINTSYFTGNNATADDMGGALKSIDGSTLNIENSVFINNYDANMTSVYTAGNLTLTNTTINNTIPLIAYVNMHLNAPIVITNLDADEVVTFTVDGQTKTTKRDTTTNYTGIDHVFTTGGDKVINSAYPSYPGNDINLLGNVDAVQYIEIESIADTKTLSSFILKATLRKADGTLFTDEVPVTIKVNDTDYITLKVTGGVIQQEINSHDYLPGTYKVGVLAGINGSGVENQTNVNIIKRDAYIIISTNTPKVTEDLTISAKVFDVDTQGEVLHDGNITFKLDSTEAQKTVTQHGDAALQNPIKMTQAGDHEVSVEFNDQYYNIVENKTTVNVAKLNIQDKTITIPPTAIGSNVEINEILIDEKDNQLKGDNTVDIIVDGTTVKTVTISDGQLNVEIPTDTLTKGEHTVKFDIKESDLYNPKELTSSVTITNHQADMTINTNSPIKVLEVLEITNTIVDEKGNNVTTGSVVYKLNGTTIATVTVVDGKADYNYQLTEADKAGNYTLTAEFSADKYDDTSKDSDVEVQKLDIQDKTIIIPDTRIDSNVTISEVLVDEKGIQLKGESTVDIIIDNTTDKTVTIVNGKLDVEIPTDTLTTGEHTVIFDIKESETYNPKELTSKVNIINHQADMTINTNSPIKILETLEITNTIRDENGDLIKTGTVVYKLNGTTIGTVTVTDGRADYSYKLQPSDKAGNYTLTADFSADKYDNTTKDSDVVVLKGDIADVIIPDQTIESLTNVTVDVQLNDTNGNPVYGNSTVDVVIDGKVVENVTITDGKLNITIPTDTQPVGEHNITIIIHENENYNNKTIDMKVTIIRRDVTIDIVKNDTKTLNMVNATVTVKDVNGSLVNGGKVGFKINGVTLIDVDGNEIKLKVVDGVVKLQYLLPKTIGYGKYNLTAVYSNDKYYNTQRCTVDDLIVIRSDLENITVTPVEIKTGNNATFNFTVKDEYGNIIQKDTKIVVKVDNKTYINTTTVDGTVSFTVDMQRAEAGSYTISVIFDHNSLYNQQRRDITLNVVNRRVNVTIGDIINTTVMSDLNMNISVVEDDGTEIRNGTVVFKINGKTIVDADGKAIKFSVVDGVAHLNYTLPQAMAAKGYNITAVYSNVGYDRAEATESFTLTKRDIANVTIGNLTTEVKHNTTINTTILDTTGMQLRGVNKVSIKVDGKTQVNETEITDGNLNCILDTSYLKVGNHKIDVIVGPNSWYNQLRTTIPLTIEDVKM